MIARKQPNGCLSMCCSQFTLYGDTQEDFIQEGLEGDEESALIGSMLVYMWQDEENDWPVYTCIHWDRITGNCKIYDKRPNMCRDFPYGEACDWEGCDYKGEE